MLVLKNRYESKMTTYGDVKSNNSHNSNSDFIGCCYLLGVVVIKKIKKCI